MDFGIEKAMEEESWSSSQSDKDEISVLWHGDRVTRPNRYIWVTRAITMIPYVLATTFFVLWILARSQRSQCRDPSQGIYSPAQDVIKYETKVFAENFETKGPYMGSPEDGIPTKETDKLWEDLFQRE